MQFTEMLMLNLVLIKDSKDIVLVGWGLACEQGAVCSSRLVGDSPRRGANVIEAVQGSMVTTFAARTVSEPLPHPS